MSSTKFTYDGTTIYIRPGKKDPECMSKLELLRTKYIPKFPSILSDPSHIGADALEKVEPSHYIHESFPNTVDAPIIVLKQSQNKVPVHPLKIGIVFCGRQAPGGHNIISGLYDHLQAINPKSILYGFVGGTAGLFSNNHIVITNEMLTYFRNQGGYDFIGRAADRIKDEEEKLVGETCNKLQLNGLVLVGGAYTNTDAAHLAEYFKMSSINTQVIGVPAGESRDMHSKLVETTLGFDTVTHTYSQLIGNLCTDGNSAKKYYYFVRLPGRHSDYTAIECALRTHPNLVLLSEEVKRKHISLFGLVNIIADFVEKRSNEQKKDFGVIILPEGLIESITELKCLIEELNLFMNQGIPANEVLKRISPLNASLYNSLPFIIQSQLIISRESRGNIQLSQISTEKLLCDLVKSELNIRKSHGTYKGTFSPVSYFFGYKARSTLPTNFDCNLGYTLGRSSGALIALGVTGVLTNIINLCRPVEEWKITGIPLVTLMQRKPDNRSRAYIKPMTLNISESPYQEYIKLKDNWVLGDDYINPGPIQYNNLYSDIPTLCLNLESNKHFDDINNVQNDINKLLNHTRPGCSVATLNIIKNNVDTLLSIIDKLNSLKE